MQSFVVALWIHYKHNVHKPIFCMQLRRNRHNISCDIIVFTFDIEIKYVVPIHSSIRSLLVIWKLKSLQLFLIFPFMWVRLIRKTTALRYPFYESFEWPTFLNQKVSFPLKRCLLSCLFHLKSTARHCFFVQKKKKKLTVSLSFRNNKC